MSRSPVYGMSEEEAELVRGTNSRATADAADADVHTVLMPPFPAPSFD